MITEIGPLVKRKGLSLTRDNSPQVYMFAHTHIDFWHVFFNYDTPH